MFSRVLSKCFVSASPSALSPRLTSESMSPRPSTIQGKPFGSESEAPAPETLDKTGMLSFRARCREVSTSLDLASEDR